MHYTAPYYPLTGPHNLTIVVDPGNAIHELNESNNQANAHVVVGKLRINITMISSQNLLDGIQIPAPPSQYTNNLTAPEFGLTEQAAGIVNVTFLGSGHAVPNQELSVPIEYVTPLGPPGGPAAGLIAKLNGEVANDLSICQGDFCVNSTFDALASDEYLLTSNLVGLGISLFKLDVTTNETGNATFLVPYDVLGMASGYSLSASASVNATLPTVPLPNATWAPVPAPLAGLAALPADALRGALGDVDVEVVSGYVVLVPVINPTVPYGHEIQCVASQLPLNGGASPGLPSLPSQLPLSQNVSQMLVVPPLPSMMNAPTYYAATANVSWYGFDFSKVQFYVHAPGSPADVAFVNAAVASTQQVVRAQEDTLTALVANPPLGAVDSSIICFGVAGGPPG